MSDGGNYFVDIDGQTAGPFSITELRDLYAAGSVNEQTLYARPGSQEWTRLGVIVPLFKDTLPPQIADDPRPFAFRSDWICLSCGVIGRPMKLTPGSFLIEVALWLLFCLPGLIYSLWRLTAKRRVCYSCLGSTIIPATSPRGSQIVRFPESRPVIGPALVACGGMFGRAWVKAKNSCRRNPGPVQDAEIVDEPINESESARQSNRDGLA